MMGTKAQAAAAQPQATMLLDKAQRLEGWRAIAAALGWSVNKVKRASGRRRFALPVRRIMGRATIAVVDLEAWLRGEYERLGPQKREET